MATLNPSTFDPSNSQDWDGSGNGWSDTKETNKYDIKRFTYPADIANDSNLEYGGHKVVFFINKAGSSKLKFDAAFNDVFKENYDIPTGTKAGSTAAGNLVKAAIVPKRLKAAIVLYVPNSLQNRYSVTWSEEGNDSMINGLDFAAKAVSGILNTVKGTANSELKDTAVGAVGVAALSGKNGAYLQKSTGITPGQSKAQQLFRSVDFREFSFQYQFNPKNADEALNVMHIIKLFKYHMLPEFLGGSEKYLYVYPSEFDIKYYMNSKENQFLEKQYTAVLTSMNINYTPNGQFMTFANGMPTNINVDLNFKELVTPTKETEPVFTPK